MKGDAQTKRGEMMQKKRVYPGEREVRRNTKKEEAEVGRRVCREKGGYGRKIKNRKRSEEDARERKWITRGAGLP